MSVRELLLATVLMAAVGLVSYGARLLDPAAGFIVGGLLLAGVGTLFLTEVSD